ncbi:MAG: hypothetical protein ABIS45_14180 [Burkholderiales bacterium]
MEYRLLSPKDSPGNGLLYTMLIIAAVSVSVFSVLAVAMLTGLL